MDLQYNVESLRFSKQEMEINDFRWNLNLLKKNGDIALHFNPRFDEKVIFSDKKYLFHQG